MAPSQRTALSAAVLVGGLVLTVPGAHGVTQGQSPCTLTRNLVVVDLDNVKHRRILRHTFDARRKGQPRVLHIFRREGASVCYILSSENRSAGSVMMFQLRPYCNTQRFIIERWPNRVRRTTS